MKLRVRSITHEAEGILCFELADPGGGRLPAFEAGAHLDVRMPGGSMSRRYSLCGSPEDTRTWRIAVLNVANSRGGSRAMHERVRPGDYVEVSGPHNFFPLEEKARRTVLLGGGIGITPLLPMLERLRSLGREVELHYCTQSPERTAFRERLSALVEQGVVHLHHDNGDPRNGLDIAGLLRQVPAGTHLYYCGPNGFMDSVKRASEHWEKGTVHFEYFGAEPAAPPAAGVSVGEGVEVRLQRSSRTIVVHPEQTLLQALREAGVPCESSCEAGVCGTCAVGYSEGSPGHGDLILSEEERASQVLVCCARVAEPLTLDI